MEKQSLILVLLFYLVLTKSLSGNKGLHLDRVYLNYQAM